MTDIQLPGHDESALSHMALLGAAALIGEVGVDVRIWFSEDAMPRPYLWVPGSALDVADQLRAHARRVATGWVRARVAHEGDGARGTMSPRLKPPSSVTSWRALQSARHQIIDELTVERRRVDLEMIGGLGEPAYWPSTRREIRPDSGASRWEMKTRNRGEEFVADRLQKLADVVAGREPDQIVAGLTGATLVDDLGKGAADSRTATGFARPGPVDSVIAWCALWGLTSFPVRHRVGDLSKTPGAYPRDRVHPKVMVLPVMTSPTSLLRARAIVRSAALDAFVRDAAEVDLAGPQRWLTEHGVRAVVRFPVNVAGSVSAPERQILDGTRIVLG